MNHFQSDIRIYGLAATAKTLQAVHHNGDYTLIGACFSYSAAVLCDGGQFVLVETRIRVASLPGYEERNEAQLARAEAKLKELNKALGAFPLGLGEAPSGSENDPNA